MIVVTGGEGFIGKNLIKELERQGNIGVVSLDTKTENLGFIYSWLMTYADQIDCIFHLGAITDTTEMNKSLFDEYNVESSIFIWNLCSDWDIPLIYASSAATYGDGKEGFDDEKDIINLKPLNPYGWSKQQFDIWAEIQEQQPPNWYGLKFFNVYGYGEAHKDKMASVIYQKYCEIKANEEYVDACVKSDGSFGGYLYVNLFKSHHQEYKDGEQLRDFIYVDDIVDVCIWLWREKPMSGIYNVGTGKARTFNDLLKAVFKSLDIKQGIKYIDIPPKIKDKYQYFTQAKMNKLRNAGYSKPFYELEDGVKKYVNKLKNENS
jgi:ADP-L-glycero-D-manno-heptose 6-epimerase